MSITLEETRDGLKYMAKHLAYGSPENYDHDVDVVPFHGYIKHLDKNLCWKYFIKIVAEANVMPTPREFATFFGVSQNPDKSLTTAIKSELLRAAAGEDITISQKGKAFLKFEGISVWDIRRNENDRRKVSRRNIEDFLESLKTTPNLETTLLHEPDKSLKPRLHPSSKRVDEKPIDRFKKQASTRNLVGELAQITARK